MPARTYLLGQPARHARRHPGVRERRHAARRSSTRCAASCRPAAGSFACSACFRCWRRSSSTALQARKVYAGWPPAARFDRNLVVIGAGSAGLVTAYIAAAVKAKVTLIEKHRMGGDCLNTGCVPSKALIRTAKLLSHMRARRASSACSDASADFDFADVMERVQRVIAQVEPHDSVERYSAARRRVHRRARRRSRPRGRSRSRPPACANPDARAIVIATGARPFVPPIPGIEEVGYLTSDTVWNLRALAAAPAGAGRRADRLRTDAGVRALRRAGHAGRDGTAHHAARRPRGVRPRRANAFAPRASRC
jgi:glycine/D-amino acid oxidase-like deaminating enzyme